MTNTATSANITPILLTEQKSNSITFKDKEHEKFYYMYLPKCNVQDVYHRALIYCLGISADKRNNVGHIYNFETGSVNPYCLYEGWMTSGSAKVVRLAFNLYCNRAISVSHYDKAKEQLEEYKHYTVEDLFCSSYAPYFWEAVRIRYPEYCNYNGGYCEK